VTVLGLGTPEENCAVCLVCLGGHLMYDLVLNLYFSQQWRAQAFRVAQRVCGYEWQVK